MPAVLLSAQKIGGVQSWSSAVEKGLDSGVEKATNAVREVAQAALATRTDPWGAAFAPPSDMTVRLRATEVEDVGSIANAFVMVRRSTRKWTLMMRGKPYIAGHVMQFGTESKHVFDNERVVTQPARPFLPLRGPVVDVPAELSETLLRIVTQSITDSLIREGIADSQRAHKQIRRR